MNMKPLKPVQLSAIQLIAVGTPLAKVAESLAVSQMTIWRWRRIPEFEAKLAAITESGMEEITKKLNATALTAVEVLQDLLCDMTQPSSVQIKVALGILNSMPAMNAALEKGLRHRLGDFEPQTRWSGLYTYDSDNGDHCGSIEV